MPVLPQLWYDGRNNSWMTQRFYLVHQLERRPVALQLGQRVGMILFVGRERHGNSWFRAGGEGW